MRLVLVVLLVGCGREGFDDVANVVDVTAHGSHTCAITADGRVWCWGYNAYGELGRGRFSRGEIQGGVDLPESASRVDNGEDISFAIAGTDRRLWAWGANLEGQLGLGYLGNLVPTPQPVLITEPVSQVAGGQVHACALAASGSVYCFGMNGCGQLGDGTTTTNHTPRQVAGLTGIRAIAVQDVGGCALDEAGQVRCWGSPAATASAGGGTCFGQVATPTPLVLPPIVELEGGCHQTMCMAAADGSVWCQGDNDDGTIGDGTTTQRLVPTRVQNLGGAGPNVIDVRVGAGFACGRTADHQVYCWGDNDVGQLGIGSVGTPSLTPVPLPFFDGTIAIDQLSLGCSHACVRSAGELYCWGGNSVLQLGDGTVQDRSTPVPIRVYHGP